MSNRGWTVRAWIRDHEIVKHTDSEKNALIIARKFKDAAATLGLMMELKIIIVDNSV